MKFWSMKNKSDTTGILYLFGEISNETWWGDEITPAEFVKDLEALGDIKSLEIHINSPGGDVFAGQTIHSILARKAAAGVRVTAYIDGLAASIASVIAMAADEVIMPKNAMMMIHKAWTHISGNADDFRAMAEEMDKIDESLIVVYTEKTGLERDEIIEMLSAETWLTAEEAVEKGFADTLEERQIAACMKDGKMVFNDLAVDPERFGHAPNLEEIADNGEETQPAADKQKLIDQEDYFRRIKKKLYGGNDK